MPGSDLHSVLVSNLQAGVLFGLTLIIHESEVV